jgi:hypothetical protein
MDMNTQPQIPYWKRVVEQKSYRNNLDCRDLDALVSMLPPELLKLKFKEVEPEAFSLPEEYTTEDIEEAVNKVVRYLGLNKGKRPRKGLGQSYSPNVERSVNVTFKRFIHEGRTDAFAYICDRERKFIDIYFDLDAIEKRELTPSSVMEAIIHEVCHEMLWTYGYQVTKGYRDISPKQVTEYLTEICIVYTGFGKIMSNSSRHAEQRGLSDPGYIDWWQVSYLRQKFFNAPVPLRHTGLVSWLELDDLIAKCQWLKNLYGGSKVVAFRLLYIFIFLYVNKHSEGLNTNPTIEKVLACIGLCMFFPWKIKPMFGCLTPFLVLFGLVHLFGTTSGVLLGTSWYWPTLVSVCLIFLLLLWKMKSKLGYCGIFIYLSLFSFLFGSKQYSNGILSDTSLKFPILVVFCICGYFIFRSKNEDKS